MFIYRLLIIAFSPAIVGHILWQSITKKSGRYFLQRLGFSYSLLPKNSLWFHCASVGEVITLLPLLKNLHQKDDQLKFIITTNTITGSKIIRQQKLNYLFHSYLPFDWFFSINHFIKTVNPVTLYVMETEIWPNLFSICFNNKIPVHIINARLSSKTTSANNWVKSLLKKSLSKVTAIYGRTEKDAQSYYYLGAPDKIIKTAGNLKLTTALIDKQEINSYRNAIEQDYVLLASTHKDEEQQIYKIWNKLKRNELLIIAPRHPERGASIIKQLDCRDIAVRSQNQSTTENTKIFLLDTVGELKNYFADAKLVIMGGSFVPVGGHNILEPASFNSAIITGPYMENFKEEMALMLDNNAILQVRSYEELGDCLTKLLNDKKYRTSLQNNTNDLTHNAEAILDSYTRLILANK